VLRPYPAYKDSDVPWLGEVPEHWELRRGKTLFRCIDVRSSTGTEELLTVSSERGIVPRSSATVTMFKAESYQGYKLCWPGDLVINSLWAWARGLGVSRYHGIVSSAYGVYRLRRGFEGYSAYIHELVRSSPFQWELQVRSKGIWVSRLQLTDESFLGAPFPLPSEPEQSAIVRFINHVDRRIRRYIYAKQKLIKLLEDQKQAIIHHAVTRGLDPSVRLKPSGVEWLGEVPEHWEISQLRRLVRRGLRITYGIVQPGEPDASGRFMVRGQDYSFGWAKPETIFRVSDAIEIPYKRSRLSTGDIVLTIVGAGVGNVSIVPPWLDGANITQTTARVSIDPSKAEAAFIAAALEGPVGRSSVELYVKGAAQPGLNLEHVRVFLVPVPPLEEQREIVSAILSKITPLQNNIERAHGAISLLREFRNRLIADVVTGKSDVREAAAQLPDEEEEQEPLADAALALGYDETRDAGPDDPAEGDEA
jgi:type I restriction enzyme, S subunit